MTLKKQISSNLVLSEVVLLYMYLICPLQSLGLDFSNMSWYKKRLVHANIRGHIKYIY